ncbi:MAG TPA: tetratricopeptide repeat protein [Steroidobacteraceae bacterium]
MTVTSNDSMAPDAHSSSIDFFISRRGSAAVVAQEVAEILKEEGYTILVQDYDIPFSADFIAAMHEALMRSQHLIVLLTKDYAASRFTMMELTNFLAAAGKSADERRVVVLRIDDCEPEGILAGAVYGDLVDIADPAERKRRILAAAEGRSTAQPRRHKLFENAPPRDAKFTGRDDHLAAIHGHFAGGEHIALHGLGGTGKSALAAEYAYRFANEYAGVWWASAEQRTLLVASLAALGGRLDPRLANISEQETAAKAGLARLAGLATPFLLVYDNVETPDVVRDLSPTRGARILMTTQWSDWAGRAAEVKLESLREDVAAQFLQSRGERSDPAGALRLAQALGCLPLALEHAGAYCRLAGRSLSFDDYRRRIDTHVTRPPRGYPASVARTFAMAIEKAAAEATDAETLLGLFAFLAPEHIPLDLVSEDILDIVARSDALMALASTSLIEHQELADAAPAVTVHRLVQAAMRSRLAANAGAIGVLETLAGALAAAVPEGAYDTPSHWPACSQLLPHVLAFREHAADAGLKSGAFAVVCDRMGEFLYARGSLESAKLMFRQAVDVGRLAFGSRDLAVAKASNNLALVMHDLNPSDDAEALLRQALDIERECVGEEHSSYGRTLTSLASVLSAHGRIEEAETSLREAIALGERTLGRGHRDVTMRLGNLATLLHRKGQTIEAEALFREAITSGEASLGRDHPQVIVRLNNLALLLQGENRTSEAEKLYKEAVESTERKLGGDHVYLATCLHNLANLQRDSGRATEAEPRYLPAITIMTQNLGIDHVATARARANYAALLLAIGRISEAHEHSLAAVAAHSKTLGEDHRWTVESRHTLDGCQAELAQSGK